MSRIIIANFPKHSTMRYQEYLPVAPLLPFVESFWHFRTTETDSSQIPVQRCLPLGTIEIIFQVDHKPCFILNQSGDWNASPPVFITGFYTDTAFWKASPDSFMFSIRLRPETLGELFNCPGNLIANNYVTADDLIGKMATDILSEMTGIFDPLKLVAIAQKHLLKKVYDLKNQRNYVADACRLIRNSNGSISLETLTEKIYISKRQLQRGFKEHFGASPKTFQRIIRFRGAYQYVRQQKPGSLRWADVSYESGYADQAHFIRDFREFTGEVPTTLSQHSEAFFQTLESCPRIAFHLQ